MNANIDWQGFFFAPENKWLDRLQKIADRRFVDRALAEEALNYAIEVVSKDNWKMLDRYSGKSSQTGYLIVVFTSRFEDFARVRFGRKRPPSWIVKLGPTWGRIFQMLCLERLHLEQIKDRLANIDADSTLVTHAARIIYGKVADCGARGMLQSVFDEDDPKYANNTYEHTVIGDNTKKNNLHLLHQLMNDLIDGVNNNDSSIATEFNHKVKLTDLERMMLRLVFLENFSIPKAANRLRIAEHTFRRQMKSLLQRINIALEELGVSK